MTHERELGVWSYPHFVRYLQALIFKLTPRPHHCTQTVLDAANEIITERVAPRSLKHLVTETPHRPGRGQTARQAANAICEIIEYWAGFHSIRFDDDQDRYAAALATARCAEREALDVGLTPDDLYECAVAANAGDAVDTNRRDAAIAAMSAGHFKLAHEIATSTPGENN
jgi:hypothetical protein